MPAEREAELNGVELALTGRFASMTHAEIEPLVVAAGGRVVAVPTVDTELLVVGRGGPPLGEDGRLTESLRQARRLQASGASIEIVGEEELLSRLEREDLAADLRRLYTTSQLARMLGVPAARLRAWSRAGLIRPVRAVGRLLWFDFAEVASARRLVQLARRGLTPARLRRSLALLSGWWETERLGLSQLETLERGGPLLVRLADGRLAEPSGQLRLGFEGQAESSTTTRLPPAIPGRVNEALAQAARHFERGIAAEEQGQLEAAVGAYERCLEVGGPDAETCFNLGNALYGLGRADEATRRFSQATSLDPEFAEAWNNLGNVLTGLGRTEEGLTAYRRALDLAPDYADVHYNLAETLAARGDVAAARHHWRAYLARDPGGESAATVRQRLAESEE